MCYLFYINSNILCIFYMYQKRIHNNELFWYISYLLGLNKIHLCIFHKYPFQWLYFDNFLNLQNQVICIFEFLHLIVLQKYNFLYIWDIVLYRILHNYLYMSNHHFHLGNIHQHIFYINFLHHCILSSYCFLLYIF
jgi:hypothetical protein